MKKLKLLVLLLFIAGSIIAQKESKKIVTIIGNVTGNPGDYTKIYYFTSTIPIDSVVVTNGMFIIKVPFTKAYTQLLYTQFETKNHSSYRPLPLLIDKPGTITINMNIEKGAFASQVKGSNTTVSYHTFLSQQLNEYTKVAGILNKLYGKPNLPPDDRDYSKFNDTRDSLYKVYLTPMITNFVLENRDAYVGAFVLASSGRTALDIEQLENTFKMLSYKNRKSQSGKKIEAYIYGLKNAEIGQKIKNFMLPDSEGEIFSFENLKGKYVWIDFWASWCVPCKLAFPNMREFYAKYKNSQFEILGISTDENKQSWLKAVNEIKNPWPQIWDNKNLFSEFAVTAFPSSFLIDPYGKIILKEVGYDPKTKPEMEKKLEELLGKSD